MMQSKLTPKAGDEIMSLAEILKEEGRVEGKLEGKIEIAKHMLDAGSDLAFILKVTQLPLAQIKALQKN